MTRKERKRMGTRIKVIVLCLLISAMLIAFRITLLAQTEATIGSANELMTLDVQVASVTAEYNALNDSLTASGKVFIDVDKNQDKYIKALSVLCDANKLNIYKMTSTEAGSLGNGLNSMTVQIELEGDFKHITSFIKDVNDSSMICRISTFSYRQTDTMFSWMRRGIDEESTIDWWSLSELTEYLTEDNETVDRSDLDLLDANALMRQGTARCYLEIQFIGVEG